MELPLRHFGSVVFDFLFLSAELRNVNVAPYPCKAPALPTGDPDTK